MTVTLILVLSILVAVLLAALVVDRLEQRAARRDRAVMRRLHTYLASLPPARPW